MPIFRRRRRLPNIFVKAVWDPEVEVWVATSDDVPGLATEADTREALLEKLKVMIPELLEANDMLPDADIPEIPFHLLSEQAAKAPYHRRH